MGIIAWIIFGFFTGLVARALLPGNQKMGFIKTTLLGVAGSFAGGTVASLMSGHPVDHLHSAGFIGSVIGGIVLLALGSRMGNRNR